MRHVDANETLIQSIVKKSTPIDSSAITSLLLFKKHLADKHIHYLLPDNNTIIIEPLSIIWGEFV